jgi:hypothetical protein
MSKRAFTSIKPLRLKALIHLQSQITPASYFFVIAEDDLAENFAEISGMSVPRIAPVGSYIAESKTEQFGLLLPLPLRTPVRFSADRRTFL